MRRADLQKKSIGHRGWNALGRTHVLAAAAAAAAAGRMTNNSGAQRGTSGNHKYFSPHYSHILLPPLLSSPCPSSPPLPLLPVHHLLLLEPTATNIAGLFLLLVRQMLIAHFFFKNKTSFRTFLRQVCRLLAPLEQHLEVF